jgi:C-terminal processing protease CtpA/Prc
VKKVMPNTPAQGQLNAGDAILAIGGYDATQLTHAQAAQIIRNSTNQLQMTLAKGHLKTLKPSGPIKFSAGAAAGYGRPY